MVCCRSLREKCQIWVPEPYFGEVRGDPQPFLMACWKVHIWWLCISLNRTCSLSIRVPELWREMCTALLFLQGSTSLHSHFTWTGSSPINHSCRQKIRDTGLTDGEDRIPLCSLVLTQLPKCDRQTDGFAVAYTSLAKVCFAERCKPHHGVTPYIKMFINIIGVSRRRQLSVKCLHAYIISIELPTSWNVRYHGAYYHHRIIK